MTTGWHIVFLFLKFLDPLLTCSCFFISLEIFHKCRGVFVEILYRFIDLNNSDNDVADKNDRRDYIFGS